MRAWLSFLALVVVAIVATRLGERTTAPKPASAGLAEFSAERAMPILRMQTAEGIRVSGTPSARATAERLAAHLRTLGGVEVELQEATGTREYTNTPFPYPVFVYRTLNVLARLPGRSREAVLLNAHYDTTGTSVGAGDDAYGVATMVEVLRAMSQGPARERSVIALLNGGEEYGLRGADGFTHHPWAKDVRGYLYIDGMAIGRPRLLNVTPGHPELLSLFAKHAPRPSANILMQDLLDKVNIGADGDFRPFDEAGLAGLSIASINDLASAHSSRDLPERVDPSSLQMMGDTTLALAHALVQTPAGPPHEGARSVYFDVFGQSLITYSTTTATLLGWIGIALAVAALALAVRRGRLTGRKLARGFLWSSLAHIAGFAAGLLVAILLAFVLRRPHGWYTAPWLSALAFPPAAAAALLGVHAAFRRRVQESAALPWIVWGASIAGWAFWLLLATLGKVGMGYLALVWTLSLSLGLLVAMRLPAQAKAVLLVSLAPGVFLTTNLALPVLGALLPQTGGLVLPIPADPIAAVLTTLPSLMVLSGAVIVVQFEEGIGKAARVALGLAALGMLVLALRAPFDVEHPRRVIATHIESEGKSAILLRAFDALPLDADLAGVADVKPARAGAFPGIPYMPDPTHEVAAQAPRMEPARVEVLQSVSGSDGTRKVSLRLFASSPHLTVLIPRRRLAGWSLTPSLPKEPAGGDRDMILYSGMRAEGEVLELDVRGAEPLEIELHASDPRPGEELDALLQKLPKHVVFWPEMDRVVRTSI